MKKRSETVLQQSSLVIYCKEFWEVAYARCRASLTRDEASGVAWEVVSSPYHCKVLPASKMLKAINNMTKMTCCQTAKGQQTLTLVTK